MLWLLTRVNLRCVACFTCYVLQATLVSDSSSSSLGSSTSGQKGWDKSGILGGYEASCYSKVSTAVCACEGARGGDAPASEGHQVGQHVILLQQSERLWCVVGGQELEMTGRMGRGGGDDGQM